MEVGQEKSGASKRTRVLETEKLNALIAQRCRDRGSWWPSKIDIEWRKQMSSWMDCIIFWDWLRTFNTRVAKRPLS
jgi:hypothetical protein